MNEIELEIDRGATKCYLRTFQTLQCFAVLSVCCLPIIFAIMLHCLKCGRIHSHQMLVLFCVFVIFAVTYAVLSTFGQWLFQQQANNLRYRLDGSTLRVDGGVFFLFRKSIPLERITDVALVQGPLLRFCDIWAMQIQTAGSSQCEATLIGVRDSESVRDLILSRRQSVYGEKSEDA